MKTFEKVKLLKPINVEKIRVEKDYYFPNAYIIDLPLDSTPDHVWQSFFDHEWKSSMHLWDRKLYVVGRNLRLVTMPNNIEEKIGWVKGIIEKTNKVIDEYNKKEKARAARETKLRKRLASEEERGEVEMIKGTLRRLGI